MQWWCAAQGLPWEWSWRPYPGVWLFVLLLASTYGVLLRRGARRVRPVRVSGRRRMAFGAGLVVLWGALDWPIGALGAGYLASVHMAQFLMIGLLAPPLLLLGIHPLADAGQRIWRWRAVRIATHPLTTLAFFTVVLAVTHWPPVVDTLMVGQVGSLVLDLAWLAAGVAFWWPVVLEVPGRPWLGPPLRMGYLVAGTILNTGVFAFLTFSELPVYAVYELAPPISGFSARDDQRLAGLVMKMGGALVLWTAITILFFRWFAEEEAGGRVVAGAGKDA